MVRYGAALIVLALIVAGCGGDDSAATTTAVTSASVTSTTATTTTLPATTTTLPTTTTEPRPQATALVAAIQLQLTYLGYYDGDSDGIYGPQTVDALTAFQTDAGITADGAYGPETYGALADTLESDPEFVEALQEDLKELGRYNGAIDGDYGRGTIRGVTNLQEDCDLIPEPDGRFTPMTHVCLLQEQGKL